MTNTEVKNMTAAEALDAWARYATAGGRTPSPQDYSPPMGEAAPDPDEAGYNAVEMLLWEYGIRSSEHTEERPNLDPETHESKPTVQVRMSVPASHPLRDLLLWIHAKGGCPKTFAFSKLRYPEFLHREVLVFRPAPAYEGFIMALERKLRA